MFVASLADTRAQHANDGLMTDSPIERKENTKITKIIPTRHLLQ